MRQNINHLRNEVETTLRTFLALKQFRTSLTCKECVKKINDNFHFWKILDRSLQTSMFIGIRRLFDSGKDTFTFYRAINDFQENIQEFSKESLRKRKMDSSTNASEWIDEYMKDVHDVTTDDFKMLKKIVGVSSQDIKKFAEKEISQIYAHAIVLDYVTQNMKLNDLNFEKIELALNAIWHVYEQVWQMYENGKKPVNIVTAYPYEKEVSDAISRQISCVCENQ